MTACSAFPPVRRLFLAGALLLCAAPLAAQDQGPTRAGISVPEDRALASRLDDARRFLAEERWPEAVEALLEVEAADPAAVIDAGNGLFRGAAEVAAELLHGMPAEGQALRLEWQEARLAERLEQALLPPDPIELELLAQLGAGLPVGTRAQALLRDLWMDRGYPERAAAYGAPPLDDGLLRRMPAAPAADGPHPAILEDFRDPELPRLDLEDLSPAWSFRFDDVSTLRSWGHRVAVGNGLLYSSNGREVVALDLDSGKPRWRFAGPAGWEAVGLSERDDISAGASAYTLHAPVLADGVLLAVVQEPWSIGRSDRYSRIHIRRKLPARRLYAFDAFDGRVLWKQDVPWEDPEARQPREIAAGPPAVAAGRVYLPVYTASGTVDLALQARDLHSGELLWQRFLISGHLETNLFGNVLSELAVPPPTADLDRVFVCTHLGAVVALDAATGRTLWSRLYERTPVRTRQNGQLSSRPQWFHNGAMAYDGRRLVVAPTDSFETIAIQGADGRLLERWPARSDRNYGSLSNLIGLGPDGAYFTGLAAVRLPVDEGMPRPAVGPTVYEYATSDQFNLQPGLMIADGILSPGSQRLIELDPRTLRERAVVLSWEENPGARIGPLDATDGWLFMMTRVGIEAFASPSALLARLEEPGLDLATLDRLLPLLDAFDFRKRPGLGRRAATAVAELATREPFARRGEQMALLTSRIWLLLGESERAAEGLAPLLASTDRRLRLDAAGLLLDAPPLNRDGESARIAARRLLLAEAPAQVRTSDQSYEPLQAVLARAAWHSAIAAGDRKAERTALVQVLVLSDPGRLTEEGLPLQEAAAIALEELLQRLPAEARAHEAEAQAWLDGREANPAFLRAYGRTEATRAWLDRSLASPDLPRERLVRLLSWVYRFGATEDSTARLDEMLQPPTAALTLPTRLDPSLQVRLDGMTPLQVVARDGEIFLFLQDDADCRIFRLHDGQARLQADVPLQDDGSPLPGLQKFSFAVEDGMVILYGDRWMHLGTDGRMRTRTLPGVIGSLSPLTRIGSLAAFLIDGRRDGLRLVLIDLPSGEVFLDREVSGSPERLQQVVANERWLFLLQDRSPEVLRVDLRREAPVLSFTLPFAPRYSEVMAARPFGDGLAIPASRGSHGSALHLLEPGMPTRTLPLDGMEFDAFKVPQGFGWWTRPLGRLGEAPQPRTLNYLQPGSPRPWQLRMPVASTRMLPYQGRSGWRQQPPTREVVVAEPGLDGGTRLRGLELGGVRERWRLEIADLPFDLLEEPQPLPVRGETGWAVLLRESGTRRTGPRLHTVLVDDQGRLLDRYDSPSRASSRAAQELFAVPGGVLLRHGDAMTLLQD